MFSYQERQSYLAKVRRSLLENKTYYEKQFAKLLDKLEIDYIEQKGFLAGYNTCLVADFYLPKPHKIIVEIDGRHHSEPTYKWKDAQRDKYLTGRGFKVLRFSNTDIYERIDWVEEELRKVLHD